MVPDTVHIHTLNKIAQPLGNPFHFIRHNIHYFLWQSFEDECHLPLAVLQSIHVQLCSLPPHSTHLTKLSVLVDTPRPLTRPLFSSIVTIVSHSFYSLRSINPSLFRAILLLATIILPLPPLFGTSLIISFIFHHSSLTYLTNDFVSLRELIETFALLVFPFLTCLFKPQFPCVR